LGFFGGTAPLFSVKVNLLEIGLNCVLGNSGKGGELVNGDKLVLVFLVCSADFAEQHPPVTLAFARYELDVLGVNDYACLLHFSLCFMSV
jgi:hypothetical protein